MKGVLQDPPDDWCEDVGTNGAEEGVRFSFVEHLDSLQWAESGAALCISDLARELVINPNVFPTKIMDGGSVSIWR